jgi:NADH-quinone oxidoreductase subunit E
MDEKIVKVKKVLDDYGRKATKLIPILQHVQEIYTYLPEDIMEYIAQELKITAGQVYGAATFYAHFTLEPKGKYVVKVCDGTACHVRKSTDIIRVIQAELKLKDKQHTSEDGLFTLEIVACLGACGLAPVVVVNEDVYGAVTKDKMAEIMKKYRDMEEQSK